MKSNPRGLAVIINNEYYVTMPRREGTECDLVMLKKLFKDLKFEVETFPNLSAKVSIHILCIIVSHFFNVVVSFLYILSIFDFYIYFMLSLLTCLGSFYRQNWRHYYYYYAAFNAPFVGHNDDESQAKILWYIMFLGCSSICVLCIHACI